MATAEQLETQLAEAYAARSAILTGGQSTKVRGKEIVRVSIDKLNETIEDLEGQVAARSNLPSHTYIKRVRG